MPERPSGPEGPNEEVHMEEDKTPGQAAQQTQQRPAGGDKPNGSPKNQPKGAGSSNSIRNIKKVAREVGQAKGVTLQSKGGGAKGGMGPRVLSVRDENRMGQTLRGGRERGSLFF